MTEEIVKEAKRSVKAIVENPPVVSDLAAFKQLYGKKRRKKDPEIRNLGSQIVMQRILERVALLDKVPMAHLIHKQMEAVKLREDWGSDVTVVEDTKTGEYFLETEVPPVLEWNEVEGKLICEDASTARLIQLASGGDPKEIKRIVESKEVRLRILSDETGHIRFKLMAHMLDRAMSEEKCKVDPVKHVLNMIQDERGGKTRDAHGRYEKLTPAKSWSDDRGQATETVRRHILGMEGESKKARKK